MSRVWFSLLGLLMAAVPLALAEDAFLKPGDNLLIEGVPPIPVRLAEEMRRYMDIRAASMLGWHPTRREMFIVARAGDAPQVHVVKRPAGAYTQLTFLSDGVWDASCQPTRGEYFLFSQDAGGNENYQYHRHDFSTGASTLLTDGKSRNTGGVWSNAGDQFVYGSTRRNGKDVDLWVMNPADPKTDRQLVQLQGSGWSARDFSPDDRQVLLHEFISFNEDHLWLLDMKTGLRAPLFPRDGADKFAYRDAKFSKDGKGIYATTDFGSEFQRLAYIDLATKKPTFLTDHIRWDVQGFELSWDGKAIACITNEDGLSVLHLFDTASGKERPAPKLPVGVAGGLHWRKDNRELGLSITSARNPAEAYSIDVETGKVERWTFSESGGINTQAFAEPEIIRWKSFDGRMIPGWLYYPPPAPGGRLLTGERFKGKRPVLIDIHGGPEGQWRPLFQPDINYFVNELGVAVIRPNIRGSRGYGKSYLKLDNGFLREDAYKDIESLLDWIKTRPDLDAERVMVMGASYGGHMTLATATRYPERIRCALDVCGQSSFVTFLENTSPHHRDLRRPEYGDERDPKMREFLQRTAPLNNAHKITKPLFVVQGANDPRVPLSESEQIVRTVRKHGVPVWYLMAKDEGHGFSTKRNEDYLFFATVMFIKEHLLK